MFDIVVYTNDKFARRIHKHPFDAHCRVKLFEQFNNADTCDCIIHLGWDFTHSLNIWNYCLDRKIPIIFISDGALIYPKDYGISYLYATTLNVPSASNTETRSFTTNRLHLCPILQCMKPFNINNISNDSKLVLILHQISCDYTNTNRQPFFLKVIEWCKKNKYKFIIKPHPSDKEHTDEIYKLVNEDLNRPIRGVDFTDFRCAITYNSTADVACFVGGLPVLTAVKSWTKSPIINFENTIDDYINQWQLQFDNRLDWLNTVMHQHYTFNEIFNLDFIKYFINR